MALLRASGMERPVTGLDASAAQAVTCSGKYVRASQLTQGQWEAHLISLVPTSLLPDEEKSGLPSYSYQNYPPGN